MHVICSRKRFGSYLTTVLLIHWCFSPSHTQDAPYSRSRYAVSGPENSTKFTSDQTSRSESLVKTGPSQRRYHSFQFGNFSPAVSLPQLVKNHTATNQSTELFVPDCLIFEPEKDLSALYPDSYWLDPCKANAYYGDIALDVDETREMQAKLFSLSDQPTQLWAELSEPESSDVRRGHAKQAGSAPIQGDQFQNQRPTGSHLPVNQPTSRSWRQRRFKQNGANSNRFHGRFFRQEREPTIVPVTRPDRTRPRTSAFRKSQKERRNGYPHNSVESRWFQRYRRLLDRLRTVRRKIRRMEKRHGLDGTYTPVRGPTEPIIARSREQGLFATDDQPRRSSSRRRTKRAATAYVSRTWPNGVIPYIIQANFSSETKATIMKAMRHWENYTCLSFIEREPQHKSYIIFTEKSCGCCSYVGRRSEDEPQAISIGKNCDKKGIVIHELGHVIGFWHEHTRPDRDDHVDILLDNVVEGQDFNFKKMDPGEVNSLGEPYDYSSIMHYAKGTFAKANKDETIRPRACCPRPPIGQRIQLSPGDVRQTNKLYSCSACGRTLLEPSGTFSSPQMAWKIEGGLGLVNSSYSVGWEQTYHSGSALSVAHLLPDDNSHIGNPYPPVPGYIDGMVDHGLSGMVNDQTHPNVTSNKTQMDSFYSNSDKFNTIGDLFPPKATDVSSSTLGFTSAGPVLCQWRINAASGERIRLNFTHMDVVGPVLPDTRQSLFFESHNDLSRAYEQSYHLNSSSSCVNDYMEIRDGYYSGSRLLKRFCGRQIPSPVISSGSRLWIEYRRSAGSMSTGFVADYEAICGGQLQMEEGTLTSPNYPEFYRPSKECVWHIVVPVGYSVALSFHSFQLEKHDTCVYDYLEVRDGMTESAPLLKKLCGSQLPTPIKSTNNTMFIKFVSDSSVEKQGFTATFQKEFDECKTMKHGCSHTCVNTLGGYRCQCEIGYELHPDGKRCEDACGGNLNETNGALQTPGFPDLYPPNKNCIWKIVAPAKTTIFLNFTHFNLEGRNQACKYDFINVYSGPTDNQQKLGNFCGDQLPDPITSHTNELSIEFYSDTSVQRTGFRAVYFTDRDECADNNGGCQHLCKNTIGAYHCACRPGFKLYGKYKCKENVKTGCQQKITSPDGEIITPNWPNEYPVKQHCQWKITVTPGHRVKIIFADFELESHQQCTYDRVVAYDGPLKTANTLGPFCGSRKPGPIISTQNSLLLTFNSDSSVQRKGFRAQHTTVCGGHLTAEEEVTQNLFSHAKFGDLDYEPGQQCYWSISPKLENHTVLLRFLYFEIEEENLCTYDYLRIYDGSDTKGKLLGSFCGRNLPNPLLAESGQLYLQFVSDDTIGDKGFQAQYQMVSFGHILTDLTKSSKTGADAQSKSPVYYGKNEMLQQYQPVYANRYLFPPAWGTGGMRYFSESRQPKTFRGPRQPNQLDWHANSVPFTDSTDTYVVSSNQHAVRSQSAGRPWRFSYAYSEPDRQRVQANADSSRLDEIDTASPVFWGRRGSQSYQSHNSPVVSQSAVQKGSSWYVRPNSVSQSPPLSIRSHITTSSRQGVNSGTEYQTHGPQSLHTRYSRSRLRQYSSHVGINKHPGLNFNVLTPNSVNLGPRTRWIPRYSSYDSSTPPVIRPVYRHNSPTTYNRALTGQPWNV